MMFIKYVFASFVGVNIFFICWCVAFTYCLAEGSNMGYFNHELDIDKRSNLVSDIIDARINDNVVLLSEDYGVNTSLYKYQNPVILQKTSQVNNVTLKMLMNIHKNNTLPLLFILLLSHNQNLTDVKNLIERIQDLDYTAKTVIIGKKDKDFNVEDRWLR